MRIRSHANYQRELDARARAWTTGCLAVIAGVLGIVIGVCCLWNWIGGAV